MSLKMLCRQKGMTFTELAEKANTTVDYLSKLNTGKRDNPSYKFLDKVADILGVSISELWKAIIKEN